MMILAWEQRNENKVIREYDHENNTILKLREWQMNQNMSITVYEWEQKNEIVKAWMKKCKNVGMSTKE